MRIVIAGILALLALAGGQPALAEGVSDQGVKMLIPPGLERAPRVGLQVGHWQAELLPQEQADMRDNSGAERDGFKELDVNYAVTQAAAAALRAEGVMVDVLPATVPAGYRADAFVAIHADQNVDDQPWRGYKVASSAVSRDKPASRLLAEDLGASYAAETGLPPDLHDGAVTPDMRFYYAFNWRYFRHAINPSTPAAIVELGFITDPADREALFGHPEQAGQAVADGIARFLQEQAVLAPTPL